MRQCEVCGNNKVVTGKTGKYKMDLCDKHRSQLRKHGKFLERTWTDPNDFVISNDILMITLYDRSCNEVGKALVDSKHYDIVKNWKWSLNGKRGYVVGSRDGSKILLHRLVTNAPDNMLVDHIHHNKLDNRNSQLRVCTNAENTMNREVGTNNNNSGQTGVCWDNLKKRWSAYIKAGERIVHLGRFRNIEDAIERRKEAEIKYFGDFAYQSQVY